MTEKNLEELLKQDMEAILRLHEVPEEEIAKEKADDLEKKSLIGTLKEWASNPQVAANIKTMLVDSVDTRGMGGDVMMVTIMFGSPLGIQCIHKAREATDRMKASMKELVKEDLKNERKKEFHA